MYERMDTVILIGDPLGLRTREKIKFVRHEKKSKFVVHCTMPNV
jgi:hypothetical protein